MEAKIEKRLVTRTKEYRGLCIKLIGVSKKNFPDRTLFLKPGYIVFAECKDIGKDYRKTQRWFSNILKGLGFKVYRVRTEEDINLIFNDYTKFLGTTNEQTK